MSAWKSATELAHEKHPSLAMLASKSKVNKLKQRWNNIDFDDTNRQVPEWLKQEEIMNKSIVENKQETKPFAVSKQITNISKSTNIPNNEYNEDIIDQLLVLGVGNKQQIKTAMDNVINRNDINEITDYLNDNKSPITIYSKIYDDKKSKIKEWKPIFNASANNYKKREAHPSLVMLRNKGLLTGGLKRDDTKENINIDDKHRIMPDWLDEENENE
eukprot:544988_1